VEASRKNATMMPKSRWMGREVEASGGNAAIMPTCSWMHGKMGTSRRNLPQCQYMD
jgi:hypothetical protein